MQIRRFKLGLVVAILALLCLAAYLVFTRPTGDARRYAQMHKFGASYKKAWTGRPSFPERVTALIHFSNPSNYYLAKFKEQQRALVASGYMVQVSVAVPNLRPKIPQVWASITNTFQNSGAYCEAQLDHTRDEVRLICRKEDIPLWRSVLKDYE